MPEKPEKMDGYVRVSRVGGREGPGYIAPSVQRELIERWAEYRKISIIAWHVDEDESGGTQDRPGLREAIRRVEAHETDGIACWRLNRFARNVGGAIKDIERVQHAGGHLAFVEEDIDPTGPFGSFILTVLLAVATLERDNIKKSWAIAQERAIARGAMVTKTPLGYRRRDDGTLDIDPVQSVHVRRAYVLAAGQGIHAAYAYLAEHLPERFWTTATARRTLANRVYLGESRHGKLVNPEAHVPIISRAIWEAAQHEPRSYSRSSRDYPLSGLIHCDTCGGPMAAGPMRRHGKRAYRCSAVQTLHRGERCPRGASIMAEPLEDVLREQLRGVFAGMKLDAADGSDEVVLAERAVTEAEAELDAFAADLTMRRVLGERYHENLTIRAEAVDGAKAVYRTLARESQASELLGSEQAIDDPKMLAVLLRSMRLSIRVRAGRKPASERVIIAVPDRESTTRK